MIESLLLALALSADAFSVGLGIGAAYPGPAACLRVSTVFGGFQFLFAFGGWQAGATILPYISPWDRYVAAAALALIASKMFWESFERHEPNEPRRADPTRGFALLVLGVAVSIDALAAGVALEKLPGPHFVTAILIGTVTFAMTWLAMQAARRIANRVGPWAERGGALVLTGIAVKIAFL